MFWKTNWNQSQQNTLRNPRKSAWHFATWSAKSWKSRLSRMTQFLNDPFLFLWVWYAYAWTAPPLRKMRECETRDKSTPSLSASGFVLPLLATCFLENSQNNPLPDTLRVCFAVPLTSSKNKIFRHPIFSVLCSGYECSSVFFLPGFSSANMVQALSISLFNTELQIFEARRF